VRPQFYKFDEAAPLDRIPAASARWASACRRQWACDGVPGATVACFTARSSIQMCLQELFDLQAVPPADQDHQPQQTVHGMVRQWQQFFHGNRYFRSYMDALPIS